jgi:hypothetical protein
LEGTSAIMAAGLVAPARAGFVGTPVPDGMEIMFPVAQATSPTPPMPSTATMIPSPEAQHHTTRHARSRSSARHSGRSWRRRKGIEAFRVPDGTGNRFFLISHGKRECRRHDPRGRKRRALRLSYADSLQNGILQGVAPRPATDGVPTFQARRVADPAADNAALPSGEAWCLAPRRCGFRREKRIKGRSDVRASLGRHPGHVRKANIPPLFLAVSVGRHP